MNKANLARFIFNSSLSRYFLVGGTAAVVDIAFFFIFAKLLGMNYLWVATVGFLLGTFVNYTLSIRFVFQSGKRHSQRKEIIFVYFISLLGLLLHQGILFFLVERMSLELLSAKFIATGLVFSWNYLLRKHFVFPKYEMPR